MIIVGTFSDEVDKKNKDYIENMHAEIRKRFMSVKYGGGVTDLLEKGLPSVVEIIEVSCKTNHNITKLRDLIYDTVMNLKGQGKDGKMGFFVFCAYKVI